ncbi:bile acid:sodium symporter family protein [Rubinisphaera margarita]|uniref:bile acid:sodium symporter family protein n=1 Tax=Rubinisphaera margarita TaxID=2909586 RepID=UPI0021BCF055|nr:bile acid:sodium symporter [Rubinisphaera margarita]
MALAILLPAGVVLGQQVPGLDQFVRESVNTSVIVFFVLFGMAFTLPTGNIRTIASRPTGVIAAMLINTALLPLISWGLVSVVPLGPFSSGLLILAAVPTTLASAAVWTRKAGGNDAIPLIVTLVSNALCFLTVPFWLTLTLGQSVPIEPVPLIQRLLIVAVLPMLLGQCCRAIPAMARFATERKTMIGSVAQIGILTIIFVTSIRTGPIFDSHAEGLSLLQFVIVFFCGLFIHLVGLAAGWGLARAWKCDCADAIGVAFSASQKTLPIAIEVATAPLILASGISPVAIMPPLIYHATQLVVDTLMIAKFRKTCSDNAATNP